MAELREVHLRVIVDEDKLKAVQDSLKAFDDKQQELRRSIGDVQDAVYDLQNSLTLSRED